MSTVVLIGSGGREHALAWKLGASPRVSRKIAAPGNDAFPRDWERWELNLALSGGAARAEFERLADRARAEGVDLVVVGPDNALADGIVDVFEARGIRCFGPTSSAARIEASKAFAKEVMSTASVPTARFFTAGTADEAERILRGLSWDSGWVIKADGLAFGKGVRVCGDLEDALQAVRDLAHISGQLVIEERLAGEEISWLAFCDGDSCAIFEPARDHKSLYEGGRGPNTGGMGAFSPVPEVPASWSRRVREEVFLPVLREMKKRGTPFRGVLYAGLMCDFAHDRFWVLEFNARFGDPETQVLMARMEGDLFEWCDAVSRAALPSGQLAVPMASEAAVVVIAAAAGYPENPERGREISGLELNPRGDELPAFFVAGAARASSGAWQTSGGRVLGAMGVGATLEQARAQAYARLEKVSFPGMQLRRDIGEPSRGRASA